MSEPRAPRESLSEMLRVERRSDRRYAARLESFWGGTTRGDLLARAALAAAAGRGEAPSAAQAVFLRSVLPDVELTLACDELAADRTRVCVLASNEPVAEVLLRFGPAGDGLSYQCDAPDPGLPAPETLPSEAEVAAREGWAPYAVGPIESRRLTPYAPVKDHEPAVWLGWLRPAHAARRRRSAPRRRPRLPVGVPLALGDRASPRRRLPAQRDHGARPRALDPSRRALGRLLARADLDRRRRLRALPLAPRDLHARRRARGLGGVGVVGPNRALTSAPSRQHLARDLGDVAVGPVLEAGERRRRGRSDEEAK